MKNKWWWPFSKTVWCEQTLDRGEIVHLCDKEADHGWQHTCFCNFKWAA